MTRTTIALADDHPIIRRGLRALLEAEPDFHLVGEAEDGLKAVQLVERLKPNVLVIDVMMPGLNGLEVTRRVRQHSRQTRVVVLSMHADEAYVLEALRNGATGYVLKDASAAELVQALRAVAAGRIYLSPPFSERAIQGYLKRAEAGRQDLYEELSPREREVLHLTVEGYSSAEIAGRLVISPRTVESHRTNLMRKLGLHSQSELMRYAVRRGIIAI